MSDRLLIIAALLAPFGMLLGPAGVVAWAVVWLIALLRAASGLFGLLGR